MAVLPILAFPDLRLHMAAAAVTDFGPELAVLADDLLETMRAAPGIGITAPHVGVALRVVVIELPDEEARCYINPAIEWASAEMIRQVEGSVSMPGVAEPVERHARVRVRYADLTGAPQMEEAVGLLAVCLQHEIDQLDGIFWTRRLSRLRRDRLAKRYGKLAAGHGRKPG